MARKRTTWGMALALLLGLSLLLPSLACADTVSLGYQGLSSGANWTIGNPYRPSYSGSYTAEFYTTSSYNGLDWIGYCVDPSQTYVNPVEIVSTSSWLGTNPGSTNWLEAAWLMENYAVGFSWLDGASVDYNSTSVKYSIMALQLAIWEVIVDDGTTYSLTSGDYRSTANSTVLSLATTYLTALNTAKSAGGGTVTLSGDYTYVIGTSSTGQDILLGTKAAATPEPASLFLAASAMGGLAAWRRRRQAKNTEATEA